MSSSHGVQKVRRHDGHSYPSAVAVVLALLLLRVTLAEVIGNLLKHPKQRPLGGAAARWLTSLALVTALLSPSQRCS